MLGYRPDELIGKPMHATIHHTHPDGSPYDREDCPMYAAFKKGAVHHVTDEVLWRKDGTAIPIEYKSTPLKKGDTIIGAVVTFSNLTEQKKSQNRIAESERFMQSLLRASPSAIFAIDTSGKFTLCNKAFANLLRVSGTSNVLGKTIYDFYPKEIANELAQRQQVNIRNKSTTTTEILDSTYGGVAGGCLKQFSH